MSDISVFKRFDSEQSNKESTIKTVIRIIISGVIIVALWQAMIVLFDLPSYIFPAPIDVFTRLLDRYDVLFTHTLVTAQEIILGLFLGLFMGLFFALQMLLFKPIKRWLLPVLIASQAIPVFAIAPILMIWLGYGIASKIVMASLIIFFPVTACCYDGLRNTPSGYLDLAQTMGATKWQMLRHIQFPASLTTFSSGIRIAVVIAPIGAVAGEWVGSSEGLGYLMLQANARMMIDEMFAALFILSVFSVLLYFVTDKLLKKLIPWEL